MDFATTLKTIRKEKGYTQSSLAKELNVSQNAVYNWENKKCEPSIEMIKKIADVLDVSLYDLIVISTDLTISSEETAKMAGVILDQIHDKKVLSTSGSTLHRSKNAPDRGWQVAKRIECYPTMEKLNL